MPQDFFSILLRKNHIIPQRVPNSALISHKIFPIKPIKPRNSKEVSLLIITIRMHRKTDTNK